MSFDVVWSQNAAMNIADRDRLYGEMHRVLKPGGQLALQEVAAGRAARRTSRCNGRASRHQLSAYAGSDPRDPRSRRLSRCRPGRTRRRRRWNRRAARAQRGRPPPPLGTTCSSALIGRRCSATPRATCRKTEPGCSTPCSNAPASTPDQPRRNYRSPRSKGHRRKPFQRRVDCSIVSLGVFARSDE